MKNFKYKILNPGGNKTALVIGSCYSNFEKKIINETILRENKDVEQVGFISNKENSLEMAGGEFCINATRCAIWEYLNKKEGNIKIQVSGCKEIVEGGISRQRNVYAKIKINKRINDIMSIKGKLNYIKLDGICLAVIDENNSKEYIKELKINEEKTKNKLKKIMKKFDNGENAVGIILLEANQESIKIYPIIWVKTIDTLFYETACGSGSLAVAIYKNSILGITCFEITQPSGYSINVTLNMCSDYIKEAVVSGKIIEENGGIKYGKF